LNLHRHAMSRNFVRRTGFHFADAALGLDLLATRSAMDGPFEFLRY